MFGNTVRKDSVDFIVFLGDYIYEYKNGQYGWGDALGRVPQPDRLIFTYVFFFLPLLCLLVVEAY